ncbi:MAG TPA: cytochrome P460 family protein [Bryobacteraceae bacterium]|nr:cytochrome P460 family protein [Bryobacteraceae bacterium]
MTMSKAAHGLLITVALSLLAAPQQAPDSTGPEYTSDGQLQFPSHYREWVYLSTGFDMSYNRDSQRTDMHMFDNVFVNPAAYRDFQRSGSWPDKTMFALEVRNARSRGSINQSGSFQSDVAGVEIHVKDNSRFSGDWAFFGFDQPLQKNARMIPGSASCYSCHAAHGAVNTTFVQFYPTLLPIAQSKGTLSEAYKQDMSTMGAK